MVDADFVLMAEGKPDGMQAFMDGKLKIIKGLFCDSVSS